MQKIRVVYIGYDYLTCYRYFFELAMAGSKSKPCAINNDIYFTSGMLVWQNCHSVFCNDNVIYRSLAHSKIQYFPRDVFCSPQEIAAHVKERLFPHWAHFPLSLSVFQIFFLNFILQLISTMENYHVLEIIGEGSFGKVYKGRKKYSSQVQM